MARRIGGRGRRRRSVAFCAASVVLSLSAGLCRGGAAEAQGPAAEEPDEALFGRSLRPIEALIKAWDFAGAAEALAKLRFESQELSERLATRQAEVAILGKLKAKMIAAVNGARPRFRKGTILIPGLNGDLVKADEEAIAAEVPGKGTEKHAWASLTPRTIQRLMQRCTSRSNPEDLVASALVALLHNDVAGAEADFAAARALGANVERHLVPFAEATLAKAVALVDQRRFDQVEPALAAIEGKYAGTKWLAARQEAIAAARRRAKGGAAEAEAEALYAEAAALFGQKDLVNLKPLVEKLKGDFAGTGVVADPARKPSVAEMAEAVDKLGKVLVVRKDGKGDFKGIQAAIDKAGPKSIILIADSGPYDECPRIPGGKDGLTLMGQRGCWPVITSRKFPLRDVENLLQIASRDVTLRGLALAHVANENIGGGFAVAEIKQPPIHIRSCILYECWHGSIMVYSVERTKAGDPICDLDHCLLAAKSRHTSFYMIGGGRVEVSNSVWLHGGPRTLPLIAQGENRERSYKLENCVLQLAELSPQVEFRSCTIVGTVKLEGKPSLLRDCIVGQVNALNRETKVEHCDVYGTPAYAEFAQPGKGCFSSAPGFQDPDKFDYRLRPTSPCRKKASDGGDLGCRYTREMLEIVQKALDLRAKGFIEF